MKRCVGKTGFAAATRGYVQPVESEPQVYNVTLIAVLGTAYSLPAVRLGQPIRIAEGSIPHARPSEYVPTDESFAEIVRACWSYPAWATCFEFMEELPRLLAWTKRVKEFAEVTPTVRVSATPQQIPYYGWIKPTATSS